MNKYEKLLLCILSVFCIFTLSSCAESESLISAVKVESWTHYEETENLASDEVIEFLTEEVTNGDAHEDFESCILDDIICEPVVAINNNDMNGGCNIANSTRFNEHELEEIKSAIKNIVQYTHGLEVDYDAILSVIDEEASRYWHITASANWISRAPEEREGWSIIDEINDSRDFNREQSRTLASFDTSVMPYIFNDDGFLDVILTYFQLCLNSGQESGYLRYYFTFKKIDGSFKVIGLALGA